MSDYSTTTMTNGIEIITYEHIERIYEVSTGQTLRPQDKELVSMFARAVWMDGRRATPSDGSTYLEIAAQLRNLAEKMGAVAVAMDYYGGFADWAKHAKELAGAGEIARQWAVEIEASNVKRRT